MVSNGTTRREVKSPAATCRVSSGLRLLVFFLAAPASRAAQAHIEGQVVNGTWHRPVAKQEVRLLQPRQGMQEVATATTDAEGRFVISRSDMEAGSFYLLETAYEGAHYPAAVEFDSQGVARTNLTVYESTRSDGLLRIRSLQVLVRAEGNRARVREEYSVENATQPPRAYVNSEGTFHFSLPAGAGEPSVVVVGLMNMPLPQTPEAGSSPGAYILRTSLKPGATVVRVEFEADYTSNKLVLDTLVPYPIDHAELYVSPSTLALDSSAFHSVAVDSVHSVLEFEANGIPQSQRLDIRLSGPSATTPLAENNSGEEQIKATPNAMTRLGGLLLACFLLVLFWALGVRAAKEWRPWKEQRAASPAQKELRSKADRLFSSLVDLDELFVAGKIPRKKYWKERLELKAKLVATLKKSPPALRESYATRHVTN